MALADDLLEQAHHLAKREPKRPRQASLRRAVSTAYYSLVHLLISSVTLQWKRCVKEGGKSSFRSSIGMPPTTAILKNGRARRFSHMSILRPLLLRAGKCSAWKACKGLLGLVAH